MLRRRGFCKMVECQCVRCHHNADSKWYIHGVLEKAGTNVCVTVSQRISCTLTWLSYIIATSFTKKLQQTPAQLVTYFEDRFYG